MKSTGFDRKNLNLMIGLLLLGGIYLLWTPLVAQEKDASSDYKQRLEINDVSPRLAMFDINNYRFDSAERLGSKYVLYSFFATYCEPCIREFKDFSKLLDAFPQNLDIILINVGQEGREELKRFQMKHQLENMILVRDRFNMIRDEFGVDDYVPVTFLVDPDGKIIYVQDGTFPDEKSFEIISPLLQSETDD